MANKLTFPYDPGCVVTAPTQIYGFENYVHQALGITDEQLEQIRENLLKG
jgi:hypothetical protein